jgi:hypothetical protein
MPVKPRPFPRFPRAPKAAALVLLVGCFALTALATPVASDSLSRPADTAATGAVSQDARAFGSPSPEPLNPIAEPEADPLLPDVLGPGERMLWGPHGLMRSIGAYPLNEESREKELVLRRAMLNAHQVGGFLTLGSMVATAYCGQMIINGESGYGGAKKILVTTTIAGYFTTALLSLLTPPPAIRRPGWNSVSTHKALAWVHFTGMIITPILGTMLEDDKDVQTLHQVSGYATTAAFAGAMFVITF